MPRNERIAVTVPVKLWDLNGDQHWAELRLVADDDDVDRPDQVDCRLVGTDADDWIMNVSRETLLRALQVLAQEREEVPADV